MNNYSFSYFLGQDALTANQKRKLISKLEDNRVHIISIEACELFILKHSSIDNLKINNLKVLLNVSSDFDSKIKENSFFITPRLGTISPWSSKATDIIHNCGLSEVLRIEKAIYYTIVSDVEISKSKEARGIFYDKMTQSFLDSPNSLEQIFADSKPKQDKIVTLIEEGVTALISANEEFGLALSEDEIEYVNNFYIQEKRNPTVVELMMFSQANSEHCRHKIFNASWTIDSEKKEKTLFSMIKNTYENSPQGVLSAYKDNAAVMEGSVAKRYYRKVADNSYKESEENIDIIMKVETHNHPTAIAPYAGAATGAGGEIRDEGATGKGSKPKAGLAGFAVSNLEIDGALTKWEEDFKSSRSKRLASPLDIMIEAPIGAANFSNEFGRPNICGYFRTFEQKVEGKSGLDYRGFHKPIMIAGGLGNIKREHVIKDNIEIGAPVYVIGGPAMLIGLGGGSASSISVGSQSEDLDFASVQRDNAEMERRCQEVIDACWSLGAENPIMAIHDVGAGGLSNALPELVNDFNRGAIFDLRKVPNSEKGMKPSELWCNESQERYVLSVSKKNQEFFENLCKRERCPFSLVGIATEEKQLIVKDDLFNNDAVNIPLEFLLGKPPRLQKNVETYTPKGDDFKASEVNLEDAINRVLSLPTISDKSFLITIGDRSVTGLVARDQMVGPWQVPVADVAVTASSLSSICGEAMAIGERPPVAILNYEGASKLAVGEAIANIMAADVQNLSDIKLSANWQVDSNLPGDDYGLYKAVEAVGMDLCPKLGICIPVGKDSMFMSTNLEDDGKVSAPISLNITAFSKVSDITKTLTPLLAKPFEESELYLIDLGKGKNRIGGSALAQVYNKIGDVTPNLDCVETFKSAFSFLNELRRENLVKAYHDRSDGGLLTSLLEMGFASKAGLDIDLSALLDSEEEINNVLFSEELGFVIQVNKSSKNNFLAIAKKHNIDSDVFFVGTPSNSRVVTIKSKDKKIYEADLFSLRKLWSKTSFEIQSRRDNSICAKEEFAQKLNVENTGLFFDVNFKVIKPKNFSTLPKVAILREQGTNGHTEMAYAFYKAGFEVIDVHMNDFFTGNVSLSDFKGLVACGGFSYGDVLGAGNGWATSILFNEKLKQEFSDFFNRKDTFTLGVCNGCQMLARLKSIIPNANHFPLFVQNLSERFEARLTQVKINKSPSIFFAGMEESYLPIVIAHGEGRACYKDENHIELAKKENLVSMQFVDYKKEVASTYPLNPNGSPDGITGLTSTDGRVTILMPHPERVFRNVQFSWTDLDKKDESPWMQMFYNARNWVG